jgi:exopolysaccharide production protein ExoZ
VNRGLWKTGCDTRMALPARFEYSSATQRITSLEGMRGYAVLLVFLVHHHTLFGGYLAPTTALYEVSSYGHAIGNTGVDLFFVLSGFLIYGHLLKRSPSFLSYLGKRIRRIYPTFLFVLSVYVVLSLLMPSLSKLPASPADAAVYLVQNLLFLPGLLPIDPLITVSWSLSYEFLFYLTIPILIWVTGMRRWKRRWRVLYFLFLLAAICLAEFVHATPHGRLGLFVAGMLVYEASESGFFKRMLNSSGEWTAIITYCVALVAITFFKSLWPLFLSIGLFAITFYTINFRGQLNAVFTTVPLRRLGLMSYTYFLCHGLILHAAALAWRRLLPLGPQSGYAFASMLIVNLFLTLAGSIPVFLLIERPFSLERGAKSHNASAG